jgi:hypothetical protein
VLAIVKHLEAATGDRLDAPPLVEEPMIKDVAPELAKEIEQYRAQQEALQTEINRRRQKRTKGKG